LGKKFLEELPEPKGDIVESDSRQESPEWEEVNNGLKIGFGGMQPSDDQKNSQNHSDLSFPLTDTLLHLLSFRFQNSIFPGAAVELVSVQDSA
jgi:hypothetical protein